MIVRPRLAALAAALVLLSVFASACAEPTLGTNKTTTPSRITPHERRDR